MRNKFKRLPKPKKVPDSTLLETHLTDAYLQQGLAFHNAGRLEQARVIYEEVLKIDARNFDALHLLGNIGFQIKNTMKR